jgi:hypothetical protein
MNWKIHGRKQSWPNLKPLSWHFIGETEENHKEGTQYSLFLPRFEPPEYETRVMTMVPRCLVQNLVNSF